jgi:PBP1b-binding outer membrane lipoprotein LpoB
MNKSLLTIVCIALLIVSCTSEKKQDPFQIGKQYIGMLTDSTQVKDLEFAFPNDSVVKNIRGDEFTGNRNDIEVYDKAGKQLLTLTPTQSLDSTAVIESIQIIDPRYKTDKNISTLSTFADIKDNYKISGISTLINSIVISVNEINASFTIDKKELPANLQFNMDLKIEAVQIPDNAKIKYFMLYW